MAFVSWFGNEECYVIFKHKLQILASVESALLEGLGFNLLFSVPVI